MKKVMLVFGTRPEAIKMAPLYHALRTSNQFQVHLCVTAQHRTMLDQVLEAFDLTPDTDLNLMQPNQTLNGVVSRIIGEFQSIITNYKPDIILVHGDTATTMSVSLAAFLENIKVGHVEAGLRTHEIRSPFPEEYNRRVTALSTTYHFAPTIKAKQNLLNENIPSENIIITGNTVIDAMLWMIEKINTNTVYKNKLYSHLTQYIDFDIDTENYILITLHRRENFPHLNTVCNAIKTLSSKYPHFKFILPVHPNPKVKHTLEENLNSLDNLYLLPPQDYPAFTILLQNCYLVMTDSGGIQEEAPSLGKPLIIIRNNTERPEVIESGNAVLVGTSSDKIIQIASKLIDSSSNYEKMSTAANPFGDGNASKIITQHLVSNL